MSMSHASALAMVAVVGCIAMVIARDLHAADAPEGQPAQAAATPTEQSAQAEPAGLSLIIDRCTGCHGIDQIFLQHKSPEDWKVTVQTMIDRGTDVTEAEQEVITQYLIENYSS
jgi:mono/diheme cytochrome c family protein